MGDLFSAFDPNTVILSLRGSLNWAAAFAGMLFLPPLFWIQKSKNLLALQTVIELIGTELKVVFGSLIKPGMLLVFISTFFFILYINALGLTPYVFTPSSHLSFTLSISLPLWIGYMVTSLINQFNHNMSHLVPEGTPGALMPLMVVIESVSLVIRPFTLAVRLAANMIAGHLLLSLLGGQGYLTNLLPFVFLMIGLSLLMVLECAVACIQAYVFMILSSLYLNEHNSSTMT